MKRIRFALPLLALALLCACSGSTVLEDPAVLLGAWSQNLEESSFMQVANITEDRIECYWYLPADEEIHLFWSGSFALPEDGKLPYSYTSRNDLERAMTSKWAMRDETMTFTFDKKGNLSYIVQMGHLRMTVTLEQVEAFPVALEDS